MYKIFCLFAYIDKYFNRIYNYYEKCQEGEGERSGVENAGRKVGSFSEAHRRT